MRRTMLDRCYDWGRSWIYPEGSASGRAAEEADRFIEIDNRGSEVTIFAFAGLAAQFAGLPTFEFRRVLNRCCPDSNRVFVRDVRRLSYHLTPEGEPDGLEFYEEQVRQAMDSLGARYHVALGTSVGGSAALYFGARCQMDQVIAFSPAYPLTIYCTAWSQLRTYLDLARLVRSREAYKELAIVTLGAWMCYLRLRRLVGKRRIWPVIETYRQSNPRPKATVFYSAGCRPDVYQATLLDGLGELRRVAIPTAMHNCAGFLKSRDELADTILREIQSGRDGQVTRPHGE